jgi:hypothetical protein
MNVWIGRVDRGPIQTNFQRETPTVSDTNQHDDIMIGTTVIRIVTQMIGALCGT